ncbi:MAG: flagellar hook-associated protein FlgK [Planctomycetota bacterium]|jgi:flagellar hook-associated protein FlgK|nr:flagellar hook-associated protein FlgK [Planctomycetota bacterium]
MTTSLDIALSGLNAHQQAMTVTSHNIANAATPGYSRQVLDLSTPPAQISAVGQIGRGVEVTDIRRISDQLLTERLRASDIDLGRFTKLDQLLADVELTFAEPGDNGVSAALDRLFASVEDLAGNPEQAALRSGFIQQAEAFTGVLNNLGDQLSGQRTDLMSATRSEVAEVNDMLQQISSLDKEVRRSSLSGRSPNDLLDKRDVLLRELSGHMDIGVRYFDGGASVQVDVNGTVLIAANTALQLGTKVGSDGAIQVVIQPQGKNVPIESGSLGALIEMSGDYLPKIQAQLDEVAAGLIREFNAIHSTGAGPSAGAETFLADRAISLLESGTDLDNEKQIKVDGDQVGISALMLPSFTDSDGNSIARNLTINVYDPATGTAEKSILRYDPGTGATPASRSLDDLVAAVNSGRGGGFSVEPADAGGIDGVQARLLAVNGGFRLQLSAEPGKRLDFSRALDTRPAEQAWTGDAITMSAAAVAGLADQRVVGRVAGAGTQLELVSLDNQGLETVLGTADLTVAGPQLIAGITVTATAPGSYQDGQRFSIDMDRFGTGSASVDREWVAGDAGFTLSGRYTGDHSYDPARPWQMRVVQPGTVGDAINPPIVEFTYYNGSDDARLEQRFAVALDNRYPPGSQVPVAEGVYAVFDTGVLSAGGSGVDIVVDGQPDQAGLLPALGINSLFDGDSIASIAVDDKVADRPERLALGHTRSAGDNQGLLAVGAVRDMAIFNDGQQTIDSFYSAIVSDVAIRIDSNRSLLDNQGAIQLSLQNRRDSVSGVSIDDEVGRLIMQQQAYTASARVIAIQREVIQTLMQLF